MKYSSGVSDVFVNGVQVLRNGEHTNARPGRVVRYRLPEYVEACSEIFDRVASKRLAHPGDADLNASVIGARWRSVGDGRRVFGRKVSEADVAPLESITLALHAALEARVEPSAYFL
jgi:hypothetical protein